MLEQALAELDGVLRATGHRWLEVICCDTEAYPAQRVRAAAQVELVGGGGTDLRPGFEAATGADVVVVLTDGDTPWPARRPRPYVIVCLFDPNISPGPDPSRGLSNSDFRPGSGDRHSVPAWASVVRVPQERSAR
ncbi:VWA-like domain-containing protein [[Actinomadura] parvosata]|uniref:VWA-like domain-containing protein n=1 Tax=[Actinomadura] parvosata TaxID=1955412 RepID=UPI00164525EC